MHGGGVRLSFALFFLLLRPFFFCAKETASSTVAGISAVRKSGAPMPCTQPECMPVHMLKRRRAPHRMSSFRCCHCHPCSDEQCRATAFAGRHER
jgi:hypothetical protein